MIKSIIGAYERLPLFAQRLILRSLFSTVVLIIWAQIATHFYALRYGARLPLEGVPFLAVFATLAAVALAFVSVSTLALIPFAKDVRNKSTSDTGGPSSEKQIKLSQKKTASTRSTSARTWSGYGRSIASLWSFMSVAFILLAIPSLIGNLQAWVPIVEHFGRLINSSLGFSFASSLVTSLGVIFGTIITSYLFSFATRRIIERISLTIYLAVGMSLMLAMLGPAFDHLLRVTQYGGGLVVDIETRDDGLIEGAKLFLVSDDRLTIWLDEEAAFKEYNAEHLIAISYSQKQSWQMPQHRTVSQMLGIELSEVK